MSSKKTSLTETFTFVWNCNECDKPIDDDHGWLTIDQNEARRRAQPFESSDPTSAMMPPEDVTRMIEKVVTERDNPVVRFYHKRCDPTMEQDSYWLDIDRIRTLSDLVRITAHLAEKPWFPTREWMSLMQDAWEQVPAGELIVAKAPVQNV